MTTKEREILFIKQKIKYNHEWDDYIGLEGLIEINSPMTQNSTTTFKESLDQERLKEWKKYSKETENKFKGL